jgi:hypothetical protein
MTLKVASGFDWTNCRKSGFIRGGFSLSARAVPVELTSRLKVSTRAKTALNIDLLNMTDSFDKV